MDYLPIFARLDQRPCLVVGGGAVARRKVDLLLAARADVTVNAPALEPELARLAAEEEERRLRQVTRVAFFGVRIESTRVTFVIDVSGSMRPPDKLPLVKAAGFRWLASDEAVLASSALGRPYRPEDLYRPWRLPTDGGELAIVFRDHRLSDLVGIPYQTLINLYLRDCALKGYKPRIEWEPTSESV